MKRNVLTICMLLCIGILPTKIFAQIVTDLGGSNDGGVTGEEATLDVSTMASAANANPANLPPCTTLYSFKRNNGNGWGVCGGQGQIRIATTQTSGFPNIVRIFGGGKGYDQTVKISGAQTSKGYLSYCQEINNMPPAGKLTLVFATASGGCTVKEQ